ncbi:MAG: Asp-tRNA(Asn)/Glu-tRNA(Gln) amidotransferase subunit GatC [Archangiaceae bacterium]|nr:Asp-tRNA(Asn)/Glu-tRNA(Gln) amidotransferase subunit GatC [Archangiaceae bacterium]
MKLTEHQVQHVARLARLALTPDELSKYGAQLSAILDAVDALSQVDTSGVPPTSGVDTSELEARLRLGGSTPHLREDVVAGEVGAKAALANAPQVEGSSFAIPKVIE